MPRHSFTHEDFDITLGAGLSTFSGTIEAWAIAAMLMNRSPDSARCRISI